MFAKQRLNASKPVSSVRQRLQEIETNAVELPKINDDFGQSKAVIFWQIIQTVDP